MLNVNKVIYANETPVNYDNKSRSANKIDAIGHKTLKINIIGHKMLKLDGEITNEDTTKGI